MKRRSFLSALAVGPLARFLPAAPATDTLESAMRQAYDSCAVGGSWSWKEYSKGFPVTDAVARDFDRMVAKYRKLNSELCEASGSKAIFKDIC